MEKNTTLYSDQIFVQKKPVDNRKKILESIKELEMTNLLYDGSIKAIMELVNEGKKPSNEALVAFSLLKTRIRKLEEQISLPALDSSGCLQFWFLNNNIKPGTMVVRGKEFVLTNLDGDISRSFGSIEELLDEFIPLDTVLEEGQFKGRKMMIPNSDSIYVMYNYQNVLIVCKPIKDAVLIAPSIITGNINIDWILCGSVNESLKGADKLKTKIYKMKNDCRGQID